MQELSDRRSQKRMHFAGASVFYKVKKSNPLYWQYKGPANLKDLNKGGACLQDDTILSTGQDVKIKIQIPGERKLQLKGQVRWTTALQDKRFAEVGIQFSPFGRGNKHNSPFVMATLGLLMENRLKKDFF